MLSTTPISAIMTANPKTVMPDDTVDMVSELLESNRRLKKKTTNDIEILS